MRNIRRDPRVVLTVVDTVGNGTPLMVKGTVEIIEEGAEEATVRMATRYDGEERGRAAAEELIAYAKSIGQTRVILRITPQRIRHGE